VSAALPPGLRVGGVDARSALAVGDRVALEPVTSVQARIIEILPRRSALTRRVYDPSRRSGVHRGHAIAANVDLAVIVCTPKEPPFRPRLIDRYLVAASRDDLPVAICLNKTDLGVGSDVEGWLRGYETLGVAVLRASALTGNGVAEVRSAMAGKVSLFSGHSGVGKTSLLNALEPGLALKVGTVTEAAAGQGKGRHTTSSARLVPLSIPETFVVDTPGIRAFGIKGIAPRELASHFPDITSLASGCAYDDCMHRGEPNCAVEDASLRYSFLRARVESYRGMLLEL
jgi:ribosome biogenesis GTPase